MSAAHRVGRRVRLRLLQDSRQGRLPLLPLSGTRWRLLGSVLEGREASVTAESESEMKSRMNESEAILRAREGDPEGFPYLYDTPPKHLYSVSFRSLTNP